MRVLIVSPHFPPVNAADCQRVRTTLPYFSENGWDAEVLAVQPDAVASPHDQWLSDVFPKRIPVHRCRALGLKWTVIPGLGTLDYRARWFLDREGNRLLQRSKFDLVYFSTTVFGVLPVGVNWKRRYSVPFVIDYQDPWISDYYQENDVVPPGGKLKYAIVSRLNKVAEPRTLRACSGITSVSARYSEQLDARYPWFRQTPRLIAPFAGALRDLELLGTANVSKQTFFRPGDGHEHWIYVGRGGPDMEVALRGMFRALADWKSRTPDDAAKVRLHFIGTSYAPVGTGVPTVVPLANLYGVQDMVSEITDRIPYSTMLHCLNDADALMMFGSNDPAYTASKLYPYLLAGKPLLTIFHSMSSVNSVVKEVGGATALSFSSNTSEGELAGSIMRQWLDVECSRRYVPLDCESFRPYTDAEQAAQLCRFFSSVLRSDSPAAICRP